MCIYVWPFFFIKLILKSVFNVWVGNSCIQGGVVNFFNAIVWGEGLCWYVLKNILKLFFQSQSLINTTLWEANGSETLFWPLIEYSAPSVYRPRFIANLAYGQNSCLSRFPPLKIPRYTAKLSYRHSPQVFRHKSRKTNVYVNNLADPEIYCFARTRFNSCNSLHYTSGDSFEEEETDIPENDGWRICSKRNWNYRTPDYGSFPHAWLITTRLVTRLTRRVLLVEQELPTLPEHTSSPPFVRVTQSLVLWSFFCWPMCYHSVRSLTILVISTSTTSYSQVVCT